MKYFTFILSLTVLVFTTGCSQKKEKESNPVSVMQPVEVVYQVEGMTCDHCEMSVKKGVSELKGITMVEASYKDSTARVRFDPSETNEKEIIAAIEKRGYKVSGQK